MADHLDDPDFWAASDRRTTRASSHRGLERRRQHRAPDVDDVGRSPTVALHEPATHDRRSVGSVDGRFLRVGALAAAAVVLIPVVMALADESGRSGGRVRSAAVSDVPAMNPSPAGDDSEPTSDTGVPITAAAVLDPGVLEAEAANGDEEGDASASGEKGRPNSGEKGRPNATTECADTYHVVAGDYWLRFVDSSGATLDEWLTANNAEPDTQMYVGDELCIPDGARAPDPPAAPSTEDESTAPDEQESTTSVEASAADTTAPPATEDAASTTATTAAPAPTTTAAAAPAPPPAPPAPPPAPPAPPPTTTAAPPAPPPAAPASPTTPAGVEALIREIWPDDIEERALTIARRESSLRPDAYNGWCCYGIFQIYFRANRSFLAQYGVTSAEQLFDARTNVTIAYAMYQASGWDPWSQTDPGP